ncbi:hypothetical protein [Paeniroseomonas aquatica]
MGDRAGLVRALSRARAKDTSLDYAKPEGVAAFAERRGLHPLAPAGDIVMPGRGPPKSEPEPEPEKPAPMLPAHRDPWGRDSQGRSTTPADLTAVAEADPRVRQHVADRVRDLGDAYRDPGRRAGGWASSSGTRAAACGGRRRCWRRRVRRSSGRCVGGTVGSPDS